MNKKSTLLAAALMAVSSFTINAAEVTDLGSTDNFYYLKSEGGYLSTVWYQIGLRCGETD